MIKSVRDTTENNKKLDFGIYINADDIAVALTTDTFKFSVYEINCNKQQILGFAIGSGLLSSDFTYKELENVIKFDGNKFKLERKEYLDRVAQIIARFLRQALLDARKRFSFETVFSHESNLDIMKQAVKEGYKVYLYFVSTESPEINKFRVALRVKQKGHPVPPERIEKRYYRASELLYDAAEIAYQAFFFDNSVDDEPFRLVGHFKKHGDVKKWDEIERISGWFKKYYLIPMKKKGQEQF